MRNAIFMLSDHAFFKYAKACLNSIRANYPNHPEVIFCYDGDTPEDLTFLNRFPRLTVMKYFEDREFVNGLPLFRAVNTPKVYFRYNLWSGMFDDYDSILHLDVDTLILGSLDEMFDDRFYIVSNNDSVSIAPVHDWDGVFTNIDSEIASMLRDDGLFFNISVYPPNMANAGVFVIPKRYRTPHNLDRLRYLTKRYAKYLQFADQSGISLWCADQQISYRYDFRFNLKLPFYRHNGKYLNHGHSHGVPRYGESDISDLIKNVRILHFTRHKPDTREFALWEEEAGKCIFPLRDLFYKYA
jgi:lipopolysaccharide biosynthesis glycosyltransferase